MMLTCRELNILSTLVEHLDSPHQFYLRGWAGASREVIRDVGFAACLI